MWNEDSILNKYTEHTACSDIFQAFCDELGKHYSEKGMKYSKSKPKILFDNKKVKILVTFNSAKFNTPGKTVMVELGVSISDLEIDKKASVFNNFTLFSKKLDDAEEGKIIIENIFGEKLERIEENSESEFRYNKNFNVYGIDKVKFQQVIDFFDSNIFNWSEDLFDTNKVKRLIDNLGCWGRNFTNSTMLEKFIETRHPSLKK